MGLTLTRWLLGAVLVGAAACLPDPKELVDRDGDGFDYLVDCADDASPIHPGASETWYDGIDQDCAGDDDYDADADGYTITSAPTGSADDCDDAAAKAYPGGEETWYDGVDGDCSGGSDYDMDGDGADADGYGAGGDCDDTDADVGPYAEEIWYDGLDQDCQWDDDFDADGDGSVVTADCDDEDAAAAPGSDEIWYDGVDGDCAGGDDYDADGDGYTLSDAPEGSADDCDDADPAVNPDAEEIWYDDVDGDCDGWDDFDADQDGYTSESYGGTDCDDTWPEAHPDADETCNLRDDDCDGTTDEGYEASDTITYYADADGDSYGDEGVIEYACEGYEPAGYVLNNDDCDDADSRDYPGAAEVTGNNDDENCDGKETCYDDDDDDGYLDTTGDTRASTDTDCSDASEGSTADPTTDCDDSSAADYPGATETVGNGDDEDCDGAETCYDDDDNDGYLDTTGDTRASTDTDCTDSYEGKSSDLTTDCDDTNASIYPGAAEVCEDGQVNDCASTATEALAECGVGGSVDLDSVNDVFRGASASDGLGVGLAGGFDVDGDGFANFLIAADTSDHSGAVYLMDGKASDFGSSTVSSADVATLTAAGTGDYLGLDMTGGDLDGDGYDDVALGAAYNDDGGGSSSNYGATFVLEGPVSTGGSIDSVADATLIGSTTSDRVGEGVAALGDQDGDGAAELLVGAAGYDNGATSAAGAVYVVLGPASDRTLNLSSAYALIGGTTSTDYLGSALSTAGDADGDGTDDALLGAPTGSSARKGKAYLIFGPVGSGALDAASSDVIIAGDANGDHLGAALSGGGDLDGDGYDDLVVSAPNYDDGADTDAGASYVFLGAATWTAVMVGSDGAATLTGDAADDTAGTAVSIVPDVDGDGADEVLVGAPGNDDGGSESGMAYLIYGPPSTITLDAADALLTGGTAGDAAGTAVAGVGDTNNDGYGDLLVGAPDATPSTGSNAGEAYLLQGSSY